MKYKIIIDKQSKWNPTTEKREYEIDIEELRYKDNIYDSLNIEKDKAYVTRRLFLSEYQVLNELEEPKIEQLTDLNIQLFEGDNYIYLIDLEGNKFYAEYLLKNDFNDIYATKNEMNSAINQTAQNIELAVNQQLNGYATIKEMNSSINVKANEITSTVKETYTTKEDTKNQISSAKSEIKQTTDSISTEVSKINQSAESVTINANKVNFNGKEINLTSDNVVIKSNYLNVNKNGQIELKTGDGKNNSETSFQIIPSSSGYVTLKEYFNRVLLRNSNGLELGMMIGNAERGVGGSISASYSNKSISLSVYDTDNPALSVGINGGNWSYVTPNYVRTPVLYQTSLAEKKKNFEKMQDNAIEVIRNIDIYKYNLKNENDTDKKHIGFVIGNDYNYSKEVTSIDNTGVDNYSFTSLCCKAIQELAEQNKQLQKRLEILEEEGKNG